MKRFYFDIDKPAPLIAWLKERPTGPCTVLIGSDNPESGSALDAIFNALAGDRELGRWLLWKGRTGELTLKISSKVPGMPEGVNLTPTSNKNGPHEDS